MGSNGIVKTVVTIHGKCWNDFAADRLKYGGSECYHF